MLKVSFFSYKGGAGRTSMLYNTISYLADELGATPEEPVVVLDLDIDSKGLSYLLVDEGADTADKLDVVKVLNQTDITADAFATKEEILGKMIPVGKMLGLGEGKNGNILFITAHSNEKLNGDSNYDGRNVELENFANRLEKFGCKALVMDNPAGGQLPASVALRISDKIVVAMRITKQFKEGTMEFIARQKNFDNKDYIIVPNAVPSAEGTIYSIENILRRIKDDLTVAGEAGHNKVTTDLIDEGGIHEVRLFKFEETNLRLKAKEYELTKAEIYKLAEDEAEAQRKYEKLAKVIADD